MTDNTTPLDTIAAVVDNWRAARTKEAEWKKAKEELAAVILAALGDAETGTIDGQPILSHKRIKKTGLSQTLLKQLHPDVFAECLETKETSSGLRLISE